MAEVAEEIIRETCKELDIEIIDMAMNVDHVHLFIKYPPKYSVSWIAKRIKGRSSKLLRDQFPQLKEWCPDHLWAPSCYQKTFQKSFWGNYFKIANVNWLYMRLDGWTRMRLRAFKEKKKSYLSNTCIRNDFLENMGLKSLSTNLSLEKKALPKKQGFLVKVFAKQKSFEW